MSIVFNITPKNETEEIAGQMNRRDERNEDLWAVW